jgi:hypothetical protein
MYNLGPLYVAAIWHVIRKHLHLRCLGSSIEVALVRDTPTGASSRGQLQNYKQ